MEPSEQSGPQSDTQDVNPVFLQQLRELDIPEEAAKQVGQYTPVMELILAACTQPVMIMNVAFCLKAVEGVNKM